MKRCIYCDREKPLADFDDEHIWPDALCGDFLPKDVWRTDDACKTCNNTSGVFVDGAFIRSWFCKAELSHGSFEYLAGHRKAAAVPLNFMGQSVDPPAPQGHVADCWLGPCGANIIHIRPENAEPIWDTYSGGDPRAKKTKAGRAYMGLTTDVPFWVLVCLESFRAHFERAERFVVNAAVPENWPFKNPDRSDPAQAEDMKTVDAFMAKGRNGASVHAQMVVDADLGTRLLAKLGLAIGYKILGPEFLATAYAKTLRAGFREADPKKRRDIQIRGAGILGGNDLSGAEKIVAWPGGWVLMVTIVAEKLGLTVVAPSGPSMMVMICDDPDLVAKAKPAFGDGVVWVTVPLAREAVGPIPLAAYQWKDC